MKILGIWDGHDSGAALIVDGAIVAAVNEERFSRRKLEVRFPAASIRRCLEMASLSPSGVDVIAASTTDPAKAIARAFPTAKERYYQIRRRRARPGLVTALGKRAKYWVTELSPNVLSRGISRVCLARELAGLGFRATPLRLYDHHYCHAVAAASTCGFDRAVVLTVDGVGDGVAATVSVLDSGRLSLLARTRAPDSPGIFFEHVTNLLNMRELEDEGKVMALAAYAPAIDRNPLADLIRADGLQFRTAAPGRSLKSRLARVQWAVPNEQFARMAQGALEAATIEVVTNAIARTGIRNLALSGGVASNIQINRRIRALNEVDDLFVFPHMGDGGLALGAALACAVEAGGIREIDLHGAALGPEFSAGEVRSAIEAAGLPFHEPPSIVAAVADLLSRGRIVMWFQGRMEYGPRALGQRSILARADDPANRDRLNLILKRRVWYQPFCPSILESDAHRLLCDWKGRPDRFMTMGYAVRGECRRALAAVIGVDGTCRPQLVAADGCGLWPDLLREVKRQTGIGAVLNTSLNIHGEPLVCAPDEAVDVFRRSGADALACGPFLVGAPL